MDTLTLKSVDTLTLQSVDTLTLKSVDTLTLKSVDTLTLKSVDTLLTPTAQETGKYCREGTYFSSCTDNILPLPNVPLHNNNYKLPFLVINAQSIVNKIAELTSLVNSLKPKIIAITETLCRDYW